MSFFQEWVFTGPLVSELNPLSCYPLVQLTAQSGASLEARCQDPPLDLPKACFTLMGSVGVERSPTPASLTDLTQNSYSFPVLSPGMLNL